MNPFTLLANEENGPDALPFVDSETTAYDGTGEHTNEEQYGLPDHPFEDWEVQSDSDGSLSPANSFVQILSENGFDSMTSPSTNGKHAHENASDSDSEDIYDFNSPLVQKNARESEEDSKTKEPTFVAKDANAHISDSTPSGSVAPEKDEASAYGQSAKTNEQSVESVSIAKESHDLVHSVKGMYRILDLISEQGSGGLVDKVIIVQDSLREFINALYPGAYVSLTEVNFKALDSLALKPIGVYGSKEELVRFLVSIGASDDFTAQTLLMSSDQSSETFSPTLRSGLYLVRSLSTIATEEQVYVVFWPEDTTWDDDATSTVRRNRVTFMRYLTKITDQVVCLISSEHAKAMVWKDDAEEDSLGFDEDDEDKEDDKPDRVYTFEVAKTKEQQENVTTRPGFNIFSRSITVSEAPYGYGVDPMLLKPRLVAGETTQGFLTMQYLSPSKKVDRIEETMNATQLRSQLRTGSLHLHKSLGDDAIQALIKCGMAARFPTPCNEWEERRAAIHKAQEQNIRKDQIRLKEDLNAGHSQLEDTLYQEIVGRLLDSFPTVTREALGSQLPDQGDMYKANFSTLIAVHPNAGMEFQKAWERAKVDNISVGAFKHKKKRIVMISTLLDEGLQEVEEADRREIIEMLLEEEGSKAEPLLREMSKKANSNKIYEILSDWYHNKKASLGKELKDRALQSTSTTPDAQFLVGLADMVAREPMLQDAVTDIIQLAHTHLRAVIRNFLKNATERVRSLQERNFNNEINRAAASRAAEDLKSSRLVLIQQLAACSQSGRPPRRFAILSLEVSTRRYSNHESYKVIGIQECRLAPALEYRLHLLNLAADDRQNMHLDPSFIPSPHIEDRFSHSFQLPANYKIVHAQLLENEKVFLIVDDHRGSLLVFVERFSALDSAIRSSRHRKVLKRDKIGGECLLALDEAKRMLAVCASTKLQLHIFVFDEAFISLQASGNAFNLAPWYPEDTSISHICFVCGSEELLLIDTSLHGRVFSLITQQFRPASLYVPQIPIAVYSSPDGSCLLMSSSDPSGVSFRAFHWSTFGSTEGIVLNIPQLPSGALVLTSFVNRNSVHLMSLDVDAHHCQSIALDIAKKVTEFMFKEKGVANTMHHSNQTTFHNCLADCHAEVWNRFPVVPAVRRQTILSCDKRVRRSITFITDRDHGAFSPHYSKLIQSFEKSTKKPTDGELKRTRVLALEFEPFVAGLLESKWETTCFQAGEWLVDLLCLIPIHLAVTRENRFVPLKDGVSSADLEKSLLGAEVSRIVDSLSFGWYESLFQSYMASKPVKVVSSMGEQSVGKSFALNHLVDTSFAGSAMRTTEGVWMSVTPTAEALIVALDFEGVHSIERSAQEDTLLVLFNTAISNLVLFRNNFAISRDVTGLFQSFQSSSSVLDPSANPSLFQSTLVIIIKDVVTSDQEEIAREFSLKFQKIVAEEQDANFITRLHGGKLDIIPWPVIESRQFYKLFPALKRRLDQQKVTHNAAGEFLHTLKTLMAKLKANDWSSLSQTLAAHRAQRLLSQLPCALAVGFSEVEPKMEPLKNFDSDMAIDKPDTPWRFFLPETGMPLETRDMTLTALRASWDAVQSRQTVSDTEWIAGLSVYIDQLVDMRIDHVRDWVSSNLQRFKTGHANIEALRRTLESAVIDLKANVQLCKLQCDSCHLLCVRSRFHEVEDVHDCGTFHHCIHACDLGDEHENETKLCGFPAGHPGRHICVVTTHLCGDQCTLSGKKGCLAVCTKVIGHEDDHFCPAVVHACGEPCSLRHVKSTANQPFSCSGTCSISSHEVHEQHVCDKRMCPLPCQLCKRLCSTPDHLHGLDTGAVHLCGQEHPCTALCSADGICEIDTAPQSIEATFTGRYESFRYTKYSQVAKRLQCVTPIRPGDIAHTGGHTHSSDPKPFHFCETRCESCGYFCTLPRGHTQQEHETSHGSMSRTRWSVDGPDGTILELEGRKFSSDDDGAPMLCNLVCQEMSRHAHIDYCRSDGRAACEGSPEVQHSTTRLTPNPERAKDWISHSLYWRRSGFKDPYSRDDQANFAKCDAMCSGSEHSATASGPAQPSYCTLPLFHLPAVTMDPIIPGGPGYMSHDGHVFQCKNPTVMQQAFHVIFVIDKSMSMKRADRRPLPNAPGTARIVKLNNNRLGAVYSSLHSFWMARHAARTRNSTANRRDAYTVLLFGEQVLTCIANDFTGSPDQLLDTLLPYTTLGGNNFTRALQSTQLVMQQHWSTERAPVVIFLSDGGGSFSEKVMRQLCNASVSRGRALSFHAVSFGPPGSDDSLRKMVKIARDTQNSVAQGPLAAAVDSSYSTALNTVQLAETFLGIAESLRKPRGSLMR